MAPPAPGARPDDYAAARDYEPAARGGAYGYGYEPGGAWGAPVQRYAPPAPPYGRVPRDAHALGDRERLPPPPRAAAPPPPRDRRAPPPRATPPPHHAYGDPHGPPPPHAYDRPPPPHAYDRPPRAPPPHRGYGADGRAPPPYGDPAWQPYAPPGGYAPHYGGWQAVEGAPPGYDARGPPPHPAGAFVYDRQPGPPPGAYGHLARAAAHHLAPAGHGGAPNPGRNRFIGIYGPEERRQRLIRFHEKRKKRIWGREGKVYLCRKEFASARARVHGRFVGGGAKAKAPAPAAPAAAEEGAAEEGAAEEGAADAPAADAGAAPVDVAEAAPEADEAAPEADEAAPEADEAAMAEDDEPAAPTERFPAPEPPLGPPVPLVSNDEDSSAPSSTVA